MNRQIFVYPLVILMAAGFGCGRNGSQPMPVASDPQKTHAPENDIATTIVRWECDLKEGSGSSIPFWEITLPNIEELEQMTLLQINSKVLAKYNFNQVDIYLDQYNKSDVPSGPFFQVTFPTPVVEKSEKITRISFPGRSIARTLRYLTEDPNEDSAQNPRKRMETLRLRVLLTDTTMPDNPIAAVLIGIVWKASP